MELTPPPSAMAALHKTHQRLLSAHKMLLGRKLPFAGIRYDVKGALRELRSLHAEIAEIVAALEKHVDQAEQSR